MILAKARLKSYVGPATQASSVNHLARPKSYVGPATHGPPLVMSDHIGGCPLLCMLLELSYSDIYVSKDNGGEHNQALY